MTATSASNSMNDVDAMDEAASLLARAKRVVVLSGAGMSQESGIPTFRGEQAGLWQRFDREQLATRSAWHRDRDLVNGWYCWRAAHTRRAQPHAGHVALAHLAKLKESFLIITKNVDRLHERAGSVAIQLHGCIDDTRCFGCNRPGRPFDTPGDALENPRLRVTPQRCVYCYEDYLRPDVVWFGEAMPPAPWKWAVKAASACDLLLVIGTSMQAQPAAQMSALAASHGAKLIEINPQPSDGEIPWRVALRARSADVLPRLLGPKRGPSKG